MGNVPVQKETVTSIAKHTTCDTMGNASKAMTCENRANKQYTQTALEKQATGSGHMLGYQGGRRPRACPG